MKIYQVILNQIPNREKMAKVQGKMGRKNLKPKKLKGKKNKKSSQNLKVREALVFFFHSNFQYFPHFFNINIKIPQKVHYQNQYFRMQISISISRSVFWPVVFDIKINTSKIFEFTKFCHVWITRTASGLFVGSTTTLRSSAPRREPRWRRNSPRSSNRGVMTSSSTRTSKKNMRA